MNQNEQNFMKLEMGVRRLAAAYKDIEALNKKLSVMQSEALTMKSDNDRLKVASALLGDENHRRLMKTRVNRLIKELDVCISQVKIHKK